MIENGPESSGDEDGGDEDEGSTHVMARNGRPAGTPAKRWYEWENKDDALIAPERPQQSKVSAPTTAGPSSHPIVLKTQATTPFTQPTRNLMLSWLNTSLISKCGGVFVGSSSWPTPSFQSASQVVIGVILHQL